MLKRLCSVIISLTTCFMFLSSTGFASSAAVANPGAGSGGITVNLFNPNSQLMNLWYGGITYSGNSTVTFSGHIVANGQMRRLGFSNVTLQKFNDGQWTNVASTSMVDNDVQYTDRTWTVRMTNGDFYRFAVTYYAQNYWFDSQTDFEYTDQLYC